MAKNKGLGRGLDALFADNAVEGNGYEMVNINDITPNREQPRRIFDEDGLAELTDSIRRRGVIQPLILRPTPLGDYVIIAGERRWRASRAAGLTHVPAIIREPDEQEAAVIALIENIQRQDLNPVETAEGCRKLMEEHGLTQEQLAEELGKPRSAVANLLRMLSLPEEVLAMVREDKLSFGHAKVLSALDGSFAIELAEQCVREGLSVRRCEELAKAGKKAPKATKTSASQRTSLIVESETLLKTQLGRKVSISGNDKKGKLVIDYCGEGDLIDLVNRLASEKN